MQYITTQRRSTVRHPLRAIHQAIQDVFRRKEDLYGDLCSAPTQLCSLLSYQLRALKRCKAPDFCMAWRPSYHNYPDTVGSGQRTVYDSQAAVSSTPVTVNKRPGLLGESPSIKLACARNAFAIGESQMLGSKLPIQDLADRLLSVIESH